MKKVKQIMEYNTNEILEMEGKCAKLFERNSRIQEKFQQQRQKINDKAHKEYEKYLKNVQKIVGDIDSPINVGDIVYAKTFGDLERFRCEETKIAFKNGKLKFLWDMKRISGPPNPFVTFPVYPWECCVLNEDYKEKYKINKIVKK